MSAAIHNQDNLANLSMLTHNLEEFLQLQNFLDCTCDYTKQSSDAISVINRNGFFTYVNKQFEYLFGYSRYKLSELQKFGDFLANPLLGQEIYSLILNGYVWNGEVDIFHHSRKVVKVSLCANPINNRNDRIIGIMSVWAKTSENTVVLQKR